MDTDNYRWLLHQVPEFKEKKIIDPQSAENLRDFCTKKLIEATQAQQAADRQMQAQLAQVQKVQTEYAAEVEQRKKINWVPVILTVISSILVAGGLISLIAYNWAFISRTTKTIAAVLILLGIQAAVLICKFKGKMEKTAVRESLGIVWAIMFGAVVAFISQILRLPSNTSAFIALWAVSSVLVLYSTKSDIVFYFNLVLGIAYICSTKYYGDSSSLIYVLFASLIPYAIIRKSQVIKWFLIIYAVSMMGFCLYKTVPGLWIVAYTSLLAIFAMSKNKETSIVFSCALLFMLVLLTFGYFWKDIGWNYIRTSPSHHLDGSILDVILTGSLFAFCIGRTIYRTFIKKEKNKANLIAIFPVVILILYLVHSACYDSINTTALASAVLILMGFIITTILALSDRQGWFLIPLFLILIQFMVNMIYNPLAAFFCFLLFTVAILSLRVKYLKLEFNFIESILSRITLLVLFLALMICSFSISRYTELTLEHYSSIILFSIVTVFSLVAFFISVNKKGFAAIFDLIVFPTCGFIISILQHWPEIDTVSLTLITMAVMSVLGMYSLMIKKNGKMSLYVFSIPILLFPITTFTSFDATFILVILIICLFAWLSTLFSLFGRKEMGIIGAIVGTIGFLFTAYLNPGFMCVLKNSVPVVYTIGFFIALALFLASGFFATREMIKNKKWINPILFVHPLLLYIVACIPHSYNNEPTHFICSICFALFVLFFIYYLIKASVSSSLALANLSTVFLGIFVIIKFFVEDFSLIAKGLVFIGLGVAIALINIFLSRRSKK